MSGMGNNTQEGTVRGGWIGGSPLTPGWVWLTLSTLSRLNKTAPREREQLCTKKNLMELYSHPNTRTDESHSKLNVRLGTAISHGGGAGVGRVGI